MHWQTLALCCVTRSMYHIRVASGVRGTRFPEHFFPPPGHKLPQVLLFYILQLNHYKENETNANVPSPDSEFFHSYSQNTWLSGALSFLPQNKLAIFWPGHQASWGWLEMHFVVSVLNGLFQFLMQLTKQVG